MVSGARWPAAMRAAPAAAITQAEELGDLVEGLPGRVIPRPADQRVRERSGGVVERGMAAGDDQRQERVLRRWRLEERGEDVPLEVIDADERHPHDVGER